MSSQACSSWKAGMIRSGAATTIRSPPCSSGSCSTLWPEGKKEEEKKPAARKPKRTSFACLECSKTFPSQQAMAGHCSAHTRAGARRMPAARRPILLPPASVVAAPSNYSPQLAHCVRPQVQRRSSDNVPPVEVRYVPYARPISNQMMVTLPYLELRGPSSVSPATTMDLTIYSALRPAPVHNMPAAQLGWGTFVPVYSLPPSTSVDGAAPSEMSSTSRNLPGHALADRALRLGSGSNGQQKRTLPLLESLMVSGGHQGADRKGKRALVMNSGDQDSNRMNLLDLDLRLYR